MDESWLLAPLFFAELFSRSHSGRFSARLTRPLQNRNLVSFEPFRGGLALVLQIVVSLGNATVLEVQITDWWPDILPQNVLVESRIHDSVNYGKSPRAWSSKASQYHHITTTFHQCAALGLHHNVPLLSHQSTEWYPERLEGRQYVFVQMEVSSLQWNHARWRELKRARPAVPHMSLLLLWRNLGRLARAPDCVFFTCWVFANFTLLERFNLSDVLILQDWQ